jgi:hypothetical protein
LWQDSSFFQDSFFAPDTRADTSVAGELAPVRQEAGVIAQASTYGDNLPDDLSGVVVESEPPRFPSTGTHH